MSPGPTTPATRRRAGRARSALARLLVVAALAAVAGAGTARAPSAGAAEPVAGLRARLGDWLARSRWPDDTPSADSLAGVPWRRVPWPAGFDPLAFAPGARWLATADFDSLGRARAGAAGPCDGLVFRRFLVGGDTLAFTPGHVPEVCSAAPRARWTPAAGSPHAAAVPALFNWNVSALWPAGARLVFGLATDYEGGGSDACVAILDSTGAWAFSPQRPDGGDRGGGFRLERALPGWRTARLATIPAGCVLRAGGRELALWPERRVWAARALP